MTWYPLGPDFVSHPREYDFTRLSTRNYWGANGRVHRLAFENGTATAPAFTFAIVNDSVGGFAALFRKGVTDTVWKCLSDGLRNADTNTDPSAVAVNPHFPGMIYMGTWNTRKVYRSSNRGDAWDAPATLTGKIKKIVVDPRPPASVAQTVIYAATTDGLFRSPDNGSNWTQVLAGHIDSFVLLHHGGMYHAYAGVRSTGLFYASSEPVSAGVWINLSESAIGLPSQASTTPGFDVILVDASPVNPTCAYAWISRPSFSGGQTDVTVGLYKTMSPSTSWTTVSTSPAAGTTALNPYQGGEHFCFALAPDSPGNGMNDVLFFGSLVLSRSADSGATWVEQGVGYHFDYLNIVFYPSAPVPPARATLYICTDGGIASSAELTNGALDFGTVPAPGLQNHQETVTANSPFFINQSMGIENALAFGINKNIRDLPLMASWDNGVYMKDGAKGWSRVASGFDGIQPSELRTPDGNVVLFSMYDGYFGVNIASGVLNEGPENFNTGVNFFESGTGFSVYGTSNFENDRSGNTLVGGLTLNPITTTTAVLPAGSGEQTVQVVSTAGLAEGDTVRVGSWGGSSITNITPTSFTYSSYVLADQPVGTNVYIFRPALMEIRPDLRAYRISQTFPAPSDPGFALKVIGYGGSGTNRRYAAFVKANDGTQNMILHKMDEADMSGGTGTMVPLTMGQPNFNLPVKIFVARNRDIWVIYAQTVMGAISTPFYRIPFATGTWIAQNVSPLPAGAFPNGTPHPFGPFCEDPDIDNRFYFSQGGAVYQLSSGADANSWVSTPLNDNFPGVNVMQIEAGIISPPGAPVVKLLRVATAGRGVWERVIPGSPGLPPVLFIRRHILDQGWSRNIEQGALHPWINGARVWHWECEDIKWEVPVTGSMGTYYASDPVASDSNYYVAPVPPPAVMPPPPPINHIHFHLLRQREQTLRPSMQVRLHAQVQARTHSPTGDVKVWLLYAPCGTGLPLLNETTAGSTFNFWELFQPSGNINHSALPANSKWKSAGEPRTLTGLTINQPGIASWYWTTPADGGHYCMAMFVHGPGMLIGESSRNSIDAIVMDNPQVGQRNLNIETMAMGGAMMEMGTMMAGGTEGESASLEWTRENWPANATLQLQFTRLPGGNNPLTALKGRTQVQPGGLLPTLGYNISNLWDKIIRTFGGRKNKLPPIHPRKILAPGNTALRMEGLKWDKQKSIGVKMAVQLPQERQQPKELSLVALQIKQKEITGGVTWRIVPPQVETGKPVSKDPFSEDEKENNEAIEKGEKPFISLLKYGNGEGEW